MAVAIIGLLSGEAVTGSTSFKSDEDDMDILCGSIISVSVNHHPNTIQLVSILWRLDFLLEDEEVLGSGKRVISVNLRISSSETAPRISITAPLD